MAKRIHKQIISLAAIEAKLHLRKICGKVLRTDLMPASNDATLQERECRFSRVCVNVAIHVYTGTVIDGFVLKSVNGGFFNRQRIRGKVIGNQHVNVCADALLNVLRQCTALYVRSMEETQL